MATEIRRKGDGQSGFSLVECMIAMLITIVGVLAVEALIVNAITMQKFSRESTEAIALARAAVEEMGARPRAARAVGGDLNSNVNNYFDTVNEGGNAKYVRRWTVEERNAGIPATADIPAGVQRVTVTVRPSANRTDIRLPAINVQTLMR